MGISVSCSVVSDPLWPHDPPGSSVRGILRARILEWVAIPFFWVSSWHRDWTHVSYIFCIGRWVLYHLSHQGSLYLVPKWKTGREYSTRCLHRALESLFLALGWLLSALLEGCGLSPTPFIVLPCRFLPSTWVNQKSFVSCIRELSLSLSLFFFWKKWENAFHLPLVMLWWQIIRNFNQSCFVSMTFISKWDCV